MANYKILVVDDEEDLCEILKFNLEVEGYDVDTANSAEEALQMNLTDYNLLLLDVMMGEMNGFKMASLLRKNEKLKHIPIIFLTAKDTEDDKLMGFNIGADDYISKPFSIREVIARIKAVLRRIVEKEDPAILQFEKLYIDPVKKRAFIDSTELPLTKKEFEILNMLAQSPGKIFSREDILNKVWSDDSYVLERTVDVHITRLRKKLGEQGKHIANRSGYGYCVEL